MYDYLQDTEFLYALDNMKIKITYIKLIILDFITEKPMREIQGIASSGSLTVSGNSTVRRTINLTVQADQASSDITNIENEISLRTKIKILVGLKNPFKDYIQYGDIVWFPQGDFVVSSIQFTRSSNGCNISIQGRDKMSLLNGDMGGVLPASTTFNEIYVTNKDNDVTIKYPTIRQIIQESVEHIGGIPADKIIISDLDEECKLLVKYMGDSPIWFSKDYSSFVIADAPPAGFEKNGYSYNQDVGYEMTSFTYPGDLTLSAGDTVTALLDKIKSTLGNYEYFFDIEGNFIFQQIKNYILTSYTPIVNIGEETYVKNFSDSKYKYALTSGNTVVSYQNSPKCSDLKNDFIVWGTRKTTTDADIGIRYHLAIDVKPTIDLANKYMWQLTEYDNELGDWVLRYEYTDAQVPPAADAILIGKKSTEWREELYRQALEKSVRGESDLYYGEELIAEWRNLYDTTNQEWEEEWNALGLTEAWSGWNPSVYTSPSTLNYWLDFIDSTDAIAQYSIGIIGRRTKVVNDADVKSIYNMEVPDIVFIENPANQKDLSSLLAKYDMMGQKYCLLQSNQMDYFSASSTPKSAYEAIQALVYQHLTYNSTITINCQPKFYLEPNNLIYIEDKKSGIMGNYIITQFTIPLTYNGTMNLVASEALTRV